MGVIKATKRNMTSGEAREHATRPSLRGRSYTYYGVEGEQIGADVDEFGPTIFDNENVSQVIEYNEKGSLMQRKAAGEISSPLRARGKGSEWESGVVSLTEDESKQLLEMGPEEVSRLKGVIGEAFNQYGGSEWRVQTLISEEHDDTDNLHFHYYIHLIPRDEDGNTGPVIDFTKGGPQNQLRDWLDRSVKAAGFEFINIHNVHDAEVTGKFKSEPHSPVQTQYDAGKSNLANARSTSIQQDTLKRGLESLQKEAQKAADHAAMMAHRVEEYEQLLAAQVQIEDAENARDAALKAQEKAEADRAAALTETAETKITAAAEVEAAANAKAEAEAIAAEQTAKAEAAEIHGVELASDLEQEREAKAELADELAEVKDEVEPLRAQNSELAARLEKIEAQQAQLAEQLQTAQQEAAQKAAENDALNRQMQAEQRAFSESLSEMTQLRTENMSLTQQLKELKDSLAAQISSFKEQLGGSLRDLILWRRENVEGADRDDRKFISDAVKASQKNSNDNDNNGPKGP